MNPTDLEILASESCAQDLIKMAGSEEEAAKLMQSDPLAMVEILIDRWRKRQLDMATKAIRDQGFSETVKAKLQHP